MNQTQRQGAIAALISLAVVGCNPPQTASPDPSSPASLPAEAAILQAVIAEVESLDLCDGFLQPEVAQADSQVLVMGPDSDQRALVEIHCAMAAYQMVYTYAVYQADGSVQPLALDVFYPDETGAFERSSEATVGGLADFDPEQGRLTLFSKARGLGDCGSLANYRWSGAELELETFRYQACSDTAEDFIDPADYPQVYP